MGMNRQRGALVQKRLQADTKEKWSRATGVEASTSQQGEIKGFTAEGTILCARSTLAFLDLSTTDTFAG